MISNVNKIIDECFKVHTMGTHKQNNFSGARIQAKIAIQVQNIKYNLKSISKYEFLNKILGEVRLNPKPPCPCTGLDINE